MAAVALGPGLGASGRLTYHEAIEAQVAREMAGSGDWLVPTLGGRPWLEKPPLAFWTVAGLGWSVGRVDEAAARLPGVVAAALLALAVATLAARRFGPDAGLIAGAVQATSAWLVSRGRLAEPDVPLACLVAWAFVALDRLREGGPGLGRWRSAFFALLGATALIKGIGFGAVLILAGAVTIVVWDRDRATLRVLVWPPGWLMAAGIGLAWPVAVLARHPEVWELWRVHVTDRLSASPEHFAGEPWWQYAPTPLLMALPWTPLALGGAWRSWGRARSGRGGPDRLLWAWAAVPAALVSLASARNGHYLVHAMPPWSIWGALGLLRLAERLRGRGWSECRLRRAAGLTFLALGMAWGLGYATVGPRLDRLGKGAEWAFYQSAGRLLRPGEPLALLYDAPDRPDRWDRLPYPTPFGPVPPDLAVRLFYLDRPAATVAFRFGPDSLIDWPPAGGSDSFAVLARERDLPDLRRLGRVEPLSRGPATRWDREFVLFRVRPGGGRFTAEARRTRRRGEEKREIGSVSVFSGVSVPSW